MGKSIYNIIIGVFAIFWCTFILLDYWQKHPELYYSFARFQYFDFVLIMAVLGGLLAFGWNKLKDTAFMPKITSGLGLMFLVWFISMIGHFSFGQKLAKPLSLAGEPFVMISWKLLSTALFAYIIIAASHTLGAFFVERLKIPLFQKNNISINIATGIMLLVGVLFILGLFALLKPFIIFPLLLICLAIHPKASLHFFKQTLITPINLDDSFNWVGKLSLFLLIIVIALNFIHVVTPAPLAFDSLTLYINLPGLIRDYGGLVEGNQPYNWSLFMSLGYVLFNLTEYTMVLSFVGGILILVVMYDLGKNWLKLNQNYTFLSLALFFLTPTILHQSYKELKVDLGLLFVSLVVILVFFHWLQWSQNIKKTDVETETTTAPNDGFKLVMLMGLLSGFAMGIKLTTLFLFFAIVAGIWYYYFFPNYRPYLSIFCLSIFGVLLVRLDDLSGMRSYHLGASVMTWVMLALGLGLLAWGAIQKQDALIKSLKMSVLYGLFFALPFLPWVVKNYVETKSLNPQTLLNGKAVGPDMNLQIIKQRYGK